MAKKGKKYQEAAKLVDSTRKYEAKEALELLEKMPKPKFDETVELHVKLGVDSKHADQQVRGTVVLPHGTGKSLRVLVFAKGDKAKEAEAAGADFVGAEDLIPKIEKEMKKIASIFAGLLLACGANAATTPPQQPRVSIFSTSTDWEAVTGLTLNEEGCNAFRRNYMQCRKDFAKSSIMTPLFEACKNLNDLFSLSMLTTTPT